ncbi:hypothetical protein FKM82_011208, partial [Ascaphus truei]
MLPKPSRYCFVFALGYLTLCQITRVYISDYGQYSADFSGPMMIMTQKITSLAFEIRDGMFCKEEELTPSQRSFAVRRMPSPLEYLSYNCNFMGILAGPLCSYKDYITFIEGRSYPLKQSEANGKEDIKYEQKEPSPNVRLSFFFHNVAVLFGHCLEYLGCLYYKQAHFAGCKMYFYDVKCFTAMHKLFCNLGYSNFLVCAPVLTPSPPPP